MKKISALIVCNLALMLNASPALALLVADNTDSEQATATEKKHEGKHEHEHEHKHEHKKHKKDQ